MGVKTSHDIPDELKFLPEFYNQPNPGLYTDQQISLTCLGKESQIYLLQICMIKGN